MAQPKYQDVDDLFADLGVTDDTPSNNGTTSDTAKITPTTDEDGIGGIDDWMAELKQPPPRPSSRPGTPSTASASNSAAAKSSPKKAIVTPSSSSARTSEDRAPSGYPTRKSAESTRSFHQSFTPASSDTPTEKERILQAPPAPEPAKQQQQSGGGGGGGWWGWGGSLVATASAAVKQAEQAVKEIQKNEEVMKYAEQVRGNLNVGALRGIGGELRKQALPTFTSLIHTLAPPISQHERLQIHITHDLLNYPSVSPLIHTTFSRVMSQVEGGDLLVLQRGSEASHTRTHEGGFLGGSGESGWSDGPWWRSVGVKRDLGVVKGLSEGTKLARVQAETFANEFFSSRGGVEEAAKRATQSLSEDVPVRSSDIFLAIQAVGWREEKGLFGGEELKGKEPMLEGEEEEVMAFAVYLHDPIHSIAFKVVSQTLPLKWAEWLDAEAASLEDGGIDGLPEEIQEIIRSGGVDPREWIAEWMEEVLSLAVGVVAQRYVAKRMGVGEGSIGRGISRNEAVESGGGEAARAGVI